MRESLYNVRRRRETAAVDQDVNGAGESGFAWLLETQEGIYDLVDLAIVSELGHSLRDNQVTVGVGVLGETVPHATVLVDNDIVVVLERRFQQVGHEIARSCGLNRFRFAGS